MIRIEFRAGVELATIANALIEAEEEYRRAERSFRRYQGSAREEAKKVMMPAWEGYDRATDRLTEAIEALGLKAFWYRDRLFYSTRSDHPDSDVERWINHEDRILFCAADRVGRID